jgi:hypothetical protein
MLRRKAISSRRWRTNEIGAEVISLTRLHAMILRVGHWANHQAFLPGPILNYGAVRLQPTAIVGPNAALT